MNVSHFRVVCNTLVLVLLGIKTYKLDGVSVTRPFGLFLYFLWKSEFDQRLALEVHKRSFFASGSRIFD